MSWIETIINMLHEWYIRVKTGRAIKKKLKDVVPDLKFFTYWSSVIVLHSEDRGYYNNVNNDDRIVLIGEIFKKVFPAASVAYISDVYVTKEEAAEIEKRLIELKERLTKGGKR